MLMLKRCLEFSKTLSQSDMHKTYRFVLYFTSPPEKLIHYLQKSNAHEIALQYLSKILCYWLTYIMAMENILLPWNSMKKNHDFWQK